MAKDPSKTEDATPKRRNKAREEGNVPKGQEIGKSITVLAGLIILWFWVKYLGKEMLSIYNWFFSEAVNIQLNSESVQSLFTMVAYHIAIMVIPVMFFVGLSAFLCMRLQVGHLWTMKSMQPKFGKLFNVAAGIQKLLLNPKMFINIGKNILQATVIAIAPYIVIKQEMHKLLPLYYQNVESVVAYILTIGAKMVLYALMPMLAIGVADLIYSRWDYFENLKMSKDEVKDERKQAEGDPEIKNEQKKKMMKKMMERMMSDVPKADVIITNPIHLAVAIQYHVMVAPAPLVLAKGAGRTAERIKEIARENNIPIKENKPLARALYKSVEVGEMIPEELYKAVASILAQLNKFRSRKMQ